MDIHSFEDFTIPNHLHLNTLPYEVLEALEESYAALFITSKKRDNFHHLRNLLFLKLPLRSKKLYNILSYKYKKTPRKWLPVVRKEGEPYRAWP